MNQIKNFAVNNLRKKKEQENKERFKNTHSNFENFQILHDIMNKGIKKKEEVKKKSKEPTEGQLFRMTWGYSKHRHSNMKKHGLNPNEYSDSLNAYRAIVRERKKALRKLQQKNHFDSIMHRRLNKKKSSFKKGKSQKGKSKVIDRVAA